MRRIITRQVDISLCTYNEDRMISDDNNTRLKLDESENNLVKNIVDFEELHKAYIHIDTIM